MAESNGKRTQPPRTNLAELARQSNRAEGVMALYEAIMSERLALIRAKSEEVLTNWLVIMGMIISLAGGGEHEVNYLLRRDPHFFGRELQGLLRSQGFKGYANRHLGTFRGQTGYLIHFRW